MIAEKQIKEMILHALRNVKSADATYADVVINDKTVVLGAGSAFDSIAFTAFATELEETIEDAAGVDYAVNVDEICALHKGKPALKVSEMAKIITQLVSRKGKKSKK
ncbi:MAG: hypothetical protein PHS88_12270 [Candidatus Omnitrophica bacterium]|nr:hypothetical protein [Candidatus Omnitrophota bacterium]